jgi:hypothetical protein
MKYGDVKKRRQQKTVDAENRVEPNDTEFNSH